MFQSIWDFKTRYVLTIIQFSISKETVKVLLNIPITCLFITSIFISNTKLKLAANQAKAKQHSEAELFLFENCLLSSSCYRPKLI